MRYRKLLFAVWLLLWPLLVSALLCPLRLGMLRLTVALCLLGLWGGALFLGYARKPVRVLCFALAALPFALLLPGRPANPAALRRAYTDALQRYAGVPYVWGGANSAGIDCSGLVTRGMMDAELSQGLKTANLRLLRAGLSLWWRPGTAHALGEGYGGNMRLIQTTPSLNGLDYAQIRPGDIAVTVGGAHTMAYLGSRTWIEADPNKVWGDKVITVQTPSRIAWFGMPMRLMRWRQFEEG